MPRPRGPHWPHPTYRYAFVKERGGMACTVIHGGDPVATGYRWCPASRPAVMRILQERLDRYLNPSPIVLPDQSKTCADLFASFVAVHFRDMSHKRRYKHEACFELVPGSYDCTKTEAIRTAVQDAIATREAARGKPYKPGSLRSVYSTIRSVFAYGIEEGWLKVNPINRAMLPTVNKGTRKIAFTDAEISAIFKHITDPLDRAYIQVLDSSACRPVELDRMERQHVFDDHCVVYSYKGGRRGSTLETDQENRVYRVLPYALCHGLEQAIQTALEYSEDDVYVFGNVSQSRIRYDVGVALGLKTKTSRLYGFRKRRINIWVREGVPDTVRLAMAGHDEDIADDYYVVPFTASELVRLTSDSGVYSGSPVPRKSA